MDARLNVFGNQTADTFLKHIDSAGQVVSEVSLPAATQELVKIRASQIKGCGFCTDMHTKDAIAADDEDQLVALVSQIALINTFNRLNVMTQQPAGDYQPGQFG